MTVLAQAARNAMFRCAFPAHEPVFSPPKIVLPVMSFPNEGSFPNGDACTSKKGDVVQRGSEAGGGCIGFMTKVLEDQITTPHMDGNKKEVRRVSRQRQGKDSGS